MYCILSSDGADSKTMARFYLAVVQAKLLYGSKTWVLPGIFLVFLITPGNIHLRLKFLMLAVYQPLKPLCTLS
jgi:hypothetical protein